MAKRFNQWSGKPWFEALKPSEWYVCDSCGYAIRGGARVRFRVLVLNLRAPKANGSIGPEGVLRIEHPKCPRKDDAKDKAAYERAFGVKVPELP